MKTLLEGYGEITEITMLANEFGVDSEILWDDVIKRC